MTNHIKCCAITLKTGSTRSFSILFVILLFTPPAWGHGGRTNSEGCHNNRKTGEYHCHRSKGVYRPPATYNCSHDKKCKYMKSCAEARYQFEKCGNVSLDRDKDGIPCENLCGNGK